MFSLKKFSFFDLGDFGVKFFFVLSGFLITYLLLKERQVKKTISIKNFYVRRILRIWPLYFLLVILGIFIIRESLHMIGYEYTMPYTWYQALPFYLFFAPFMVNILYGHSLLEPLWSIGVEEIFYLFWAPLFKFVRRNVWYILFGVIAIKLVLSLICIEGVAGKIIETLKFEAMAIGGLAAAWLFQLREREVSSFAIFKPAFQIVIYATLASRLFFGNFLSENFHWYNLIAGNSLAAEYLFNFIFIYIILDLSLNRSSLLGKHVNEKLEWLGGLSYGIYMYHMLVLFGVVLVLGKTLNNMSAAVSTLTFYGLTFTITIFISFLSKRLFEDRFLKYRKRFL